MGTKTLSIHPVGGEAVGGEVRERSRVMAVLLELLFIVKASRPGFWVTTFWFYLLPLEQPLPLRSGAFWLGLLYVGLPLGLIVYAANDLTDERTDRLNPRKDSYLFGARPTPAQIAGLPLRIVLFQLPFLVLFWQLTGPRIVLWFCAVAWVTVFYNNVAKKGPFFGTLAQAGYLSVFVLAIWLNHAPAVPWTLWMFGALFAMHSHLIGEILDIKPDGAAARRTTAVTIGASATKLVIAVLLVAETILALGIAGKPWLPPLLAAGIFGFVLDAMVLWQDRPYPARLVKGFFICWNLFLLLDVCASLYRAFQISP